jgi:serine/threonine-protein phosphatase 2A regulatory subunit A
MVAERYGQLLDAIPDAGTRKSFVPCLIKLMQDEEAEVRTAAAFQVASTCSSNPDAAVVTLVLGCVKQLVEDSNQHVRAALASVVLDLAPSLGRERTIKDLLPHFLLLLRDDFHEVQWCSVCCPSAHPFEFSGSNEHNLQVGPDQPGHRHRPSL